MILAFLFLYHSAFAQSPVKSCTPQVLINESRKYFAPTGISYFIRPSLETKQIGYAAIGSGNQILDLHTGEAVTVSGFVDPVFSPDGKILAIPEEVLFVGEDPVAKSAGSQKQLDAVQYRYFPSSQRVEKRPPHTLKWEHIKLSLTDLKKLKVPFMVTSMSFYVRNKKSPGGFELSYPDLQVTDKYQTLGVVSSSGDKKYRMLYEASEGIMMKDYSYDLKSNQVLPNGPARAMCGIVTYVSGTLPMLSKDGREFSVYDPKSGSTKVYSIETCKVVDEIPALVGKLDFSPNGRFLAFHADLANKMGAEWFKAPKEENSLRIFVYDRKTKSLMPFNAPKKMDMYYPVFLADHEIAYISKTKGQKDFYINRVQLEYANLDSCGKSKEADKTGSPEVSR